MEHLLDSGRLCPLTSSCGRLFDAAAALVCNRTHVTYEAEAAMLLEACAEAGEDPVAYPFLVHEGDCLVIDPAPLFPALLDDLRQERAPGIVSTRFHLGLIAAMTRVVERIARATGHTRVCLSGAAFTMRCWPRDLRAA